MIAPNEAESSRGSAEPTDAAGSDEPSLAELVTAAILLIIAGVGAWMLWSEDIRQMPGLILERLRMLG